MALTAVERTNIVKLTVALYNAAPGASGLSDFTNFYEANGRSLTNLANNLASNNIFKALHPNFQTATEFATAILSNYSLQANADAIAFVTSRFNSGMSKGQIAFETAIAINNTTSTTGDFLTARNILNNKTLVAENYSVALSGQAVTIGALQSVLTGVTADPASVVAANLVNANPAVGSLTLTTGLDGLVGTTFNDTFNANVVQNSLGAQTNQLATGDKINGGAGVDTLNAVVQVASALNNSPTSALTPITTSVEKTFYTALTFNNLADSGATGRNQGETVNINAKSMTGLTSVGSVQSDASLLIQNLTTLTDSGVYAERRNVETMTIRMDHSGNDSTPNRQSDLTVLFDNDYLVSGRTSISSIGYFVEDREAAKLTPATPLKKIDASGVTFTINGVQKNVVLDAAVVANFLATNGTFAGFTALLQAQLVFQKTTDASLANLNFSLDTNNVRVLGKDGTTLPIPAPAITLTSSVGETLVAGGFTTRSEFGVTYDVFTEIANGTTAQTILPIIANVQLEKVGRGAEGGSLVVGGMSTDMANVFNFGNIALKKGVDQFNIVVSGDTTQMSSLSNLSSTNNTLRTVDVKYATGSLADLNIGNKNTGGTIDQVNGANLTTDGIANVSSTRNLGLKDVRTFTVANNNTDASNPASVQTNDVTLNAYLSNEVVGKYMNRADNVANAALDNAAFVYTTGSGNDSLNINISKANLAASGTATREDFTLAINAGAGNNTVTTQIGNGVGAATDAWYINQTINKNLSIVTGAGTDVVRVNGAGSFDIKTNEGNDAIYSDGSGRQIITTSTGPVVQAESNAVWVFNSANQLQGGYQNLFDLTSAGAATAAAKVANLELTVSYRGINVKVPVGDTAGATGGAVDDLTINQAIKAAINGDVYLKNLLEARDGTGRTLVVTSLTDGVFSDADLTIALSNSGAVSAAQTASGAAQLTAAQLTDLGFAGGNATANGRFDSAIAEDNSTSVREFATVNFKAFPAAATATTQSAGGLTVTAAAGAGFTDTDVAQVVSGGAAIAGLTVTTPSTLFTVTLPAGGAAGDVLFTSTAFGNVTNVVLGTGINNAVPAGVVTNGVAGAAATVESAVVSFGAFTGGGTKTIGGVVITSNGPAFTATQVTEFVSVNAAAINAGTAVTGAGAFVGLSSTSSGSSIFQASTAAFVAAATTITFTDRVAAPNGNVTNIDVNAASTGLAATPTAATTEGVTAGSNESAVVTFRPFLVAGTQVVNNAGATFTITSTGAFTAEQVAQAASGSAITGLTLTQTAGFNYTTSALNGATLVFTNNATGDVADLTFSATNSALTPTLVGAVTNGTQVSIVGANSVQANANVIDAGTGLDTVIASTSAAAREVINVANTVADADVVFNLSAGATVTVDALDTVISSSGVVLTGGVGSAAVIVNGINGTSGSDTINGLTAIALQTLSGLAGNDTITASLLGSTVVGGDGADVITLAPAGTGATPNTAADIIAFNSQVGADTITNYAVVNDSITVSLAAYTAAGALGALVAGAFESNGTGLASNASTRFVQNSVTGALSYDADGSGGGVPVLLATFVGIPVLTAGEFTVVA